MHNSIPSTLYPQRRRIGVHADVLAQLQRRSHLGAHARSRDNTPTAWRGTGGRHQRSNVHHESAAALSSSFRL
ncbi:hypothetical protein C8Q78DRAFT_1019602 [Trametes maxima]|nr:hypothetical protein C8Q78DRAFT_1019602 [Trametes maxima]